MKGVPCFFFGLCPAEPHGSRLGHQALAVGPCLWAWLQRGALVTRVQARETAFQCLYSS